GERTLLFLLAREEGFAREIAKFYNTGLAPIQKQLQKFESGGVIYSRLVGKTRLYAFDPRYAFKAEIESLLQKALTFYPKDEQEKLLMNRRRPRRAGKPL
ncbi:MAG: winged helix-turn-helix domain-containing protein, partial [Candidatus Pacebacteria bacterium]|nr:winged helix-turn-helix domain-containing protein [Candidatus Paceibacterota bacterium]